MALDIGFMPQKDEYDWRLQLDDDGYYWFLHTWFMQIAERTGHYIDLYGDARFHDGQGLDVLEAAMADALAAVQAQPPHWSVHVGTQEKPMRKELYEPVERERMIEVISMLQRLIAEARERGTALVFFGD